MKLLNADQMQWLDAETMRREPIHSIDLMERAAQHLTTAILEDFPDQLEFAVVCGKGNNGGDGLAISRLLLQKGRKVSTVIPDNLVGATAEFSKNLERLRNTEGHTIYSFSGVSDNFDPAHVCIDALLGNGFKPPLREDLANAIDHINRSFKRIVSIDINSGLPGDFPDKMSSPVIRSEITYCIGSPKQALLFPESGEVCNRLKLIEIGHDVSALNEIDTPLHYLTNSEALHLLPERNRFSYKNKFGHILAIAGSKGKTGAAYLLGKAALESGAGLVTIGTTDESAQILQGAFPEGMTMSLNEGEYISEEPKSTGGFNVLAIGPGLGTQPETAKVVSKLIAQFEGPVVVDADALNIISLNKDYLWPHNVILTPHPGEFDRLTQQHKDSYSRYKSQLEYSIKHRVIVVLKGAHTTIAFPDGSVYFNLTGTPAMAKAGSGDVLTGIIAAFLAQGLTPEYAALLGVYLHGRSGELAAGDRGLYSVNATNLIQYIPNAFASLNSSSQKT